MNEGLPPEKSPRCINVYTSASYLTPGKNNPCAAAGWSAVIIESQGHSILSSRNLSGSFPGAKTIHEAFELAVLYALDDIAKRENPDKMKPDRTAIILHTNRPETPQLLRSPARAAAHDPELVGLGDIIKRMPITIQSLPLTSKPITDRALILAKAEALNERLRLQGKLHIGEAVLEGEAAKQYIAAMKDSGNALPDLP